MRLPCGDIVTYLVFFSLIVQIQITTYTYISCQLRAAH